MACAAVVRRQAFLEVGGFPAEMGVGGEEALLALDLVARGWGLRYLPELVAHHHPLPGDGRGPRRRREVRNALWTAWQRLPARLALQVSAAALYQQRDRRAAALGLLDAVAGGAGALRRRRVVPPAVARQRPSWVDVAASSAVASPAISSLPAVAGSSSRRCIWAVRPRRRRRQARSVRRLKADDVDRGDVGAGVGPASDQFASVPVVELDLGPLVGGDSGRAPASACQPAGATSASILPTTAAPSPRSSAMPLLAAWMLRSWSRTRTHQWESSSRMSVIASSSSRLRVQCSWASLSAWSSAGHVRARWRHGGHRHRHRRRRHRTDRPESSA